MLMVMVNTCCHLGSRYMHLVQESRRYFIAFNPCIGVVENFWKQVKVCGKVH